MNQTTILVADDEPSFRKIYRDVVEAEGYAAIEAADGTAAIQIAKDMKPALILLDIIMPKKDGFAVLKALREDPETKTIPVIIFSVLGEKSDVDKGIALGANDYALKGMTTPREIMSKIRTLIKTPEAKLKGVSAPNVYRVRVDPTKGDAVAILKDLGLGSMFVCTKCQNQLYLELQHDPANQTGHWYAAHVVCPVCKTEY